jgi:hypothetical protein
LRGARIAPVKAQRHQVDWKEVRDKRRRKFVLVDIRLRSER